MQKNCLVLLSVALAACTSAPRSPIDAERYELYKVICIPAKSLEKIKNTDQIEGTEPSTETKAEIQTEFESRRQVFQNVYRQSRSDNGKYDYLLVIYLSPTGKVNNSIIWGRTRESEELERRLLDAVNQNQFSNKVASSCPVFTYGIHFIPL